MQWRLSDRQSSQSSQPKYATLSSVTDYHGLEVILTHITMML